LCFVFWNNNSDRVNRRLELTHFKAFKIDPPWGKKGV
jgi:hypothetical protein